MSRWLATIDRDMIDGIGSTMDDVRREGIRIKVMEGDMGPRIILYLSDDDLPRMARTSSYYADRIHEVRNTYGRFAHSSGRRLRRCVHMLRAHSGDLDGRELVDVVEAKQYGDIEVADNNYHVGQRVRIIHDAGDTDDDSILVGHSGVVVRCAREPNATSQITVVYVLLDDFEACGPLIVVKGTTGGFCLCGEELQHSGINGEWSVWRIPVAKHWEIPPRHDGYRAKEGGIVPKRRQRTLG